MNLVSFSLWGDQAHYYRGVEANHRLIQELLPGFQMILHVDADYDRDKLASIHKLGIYTVPEVSLGGYHGAYWRFFSCESMGAVILRDLDSRISAREAGLVRDWLESGKKFHIIRDCAGHLDPMAAGMWGCRGGIPNIRHLIWKHGLFANYGDDERFLWAHIFPIAKSDCLEHTSTGLHATDSFCQIPKADDGRYIGERFDEHNQPF